MTRRAVVLMVGLCGVFFVAAEPAHAQWRYRRSGPAMSVFGPTYNPTMSPEYRLYLSDPEAYEQLMMQRQFQYQQQIYQKQQQVFQKWLKDQKAKKDKGQPTDPAYEQYLRQQSAASQFAPPTPTTTRRGRSTRRTPTTGAVTASPKETAAGSDKK